MTDTILICKRRPDGKLTIKKEKRLKCHLDENIMEVFVIYEQKRYAVQGDCFNGFIVIEEG